MTPKPEEIAKFLGAQTQQFDRIVVFGALLARETDADVVVVGGSAIEVYTRGRYVSGDIDVVGAVASIHRVLEAWGFRRDGLLWVRKDWQIAVHTVGDTYIGDLQRTREVTTPFGRVRIAAVEDLIAKRLASAKHWRIPADVGQAAGLLAGYQEEIDWSYLESAAARLEVSDLLADIRRRLPPSRKH